MCSKQPLHHHQVTSPTLITTVRIPNVSCSVSFCSTPPIPLLVISHKDATVYTLNTRYSPVVHGASKAIQACHSPICETVSHDTGYDGGVLT